MVCTFNDLDENCIEVIFRQLPLQDKFRLRRVNRKWRNKLNQQLKSQTALALFDKPYPLDSGGSASGTAEGDGCRQHRLCELDILLSEPFDASPDYLGSVVRQLPALQHVCIRLLDTEQLDRLCGQLVEALPSLSCLELPFSSALQHFVPKYANTLRHVECSYFNENDLLQEVLTSCQKLQYLYMIGCPEFDASLLNKASPTLTYVYTMERILYDLNPSASAVQRAPSSIRGLGFVAAQHLPQIVQQHPDLTHLLLEFHGGYCTINDLGRLAKLRNLYLREYNRKKPIDTHLLQAITRCPELKSLNLQNVNVSDELFEGLAFQCPQIEQLYIDNSQMGHFASDLITRRAVHALQNLKNIKSVQIRGPNSIGSSFNESPVKGKHVNFQFYAATR